ncbi:MAG TPA: cation diffusion facilitator family transporter [Acidocella sp.]|jgi:ferrous-iron efflux pump FieF|uniref:cation diffusion facilitator family transporter n=1 Tax=Acidocella sp. TaxID=50710 RepID=UPI002C95864B|nr:cation diffusion facilitator family transporter [Acidocella sp.]HVE20965.1 cation diffusion facilitator family transporter [Acidocella sp.]
MHEHETPNFGLRRFASRTSLVVAVTLVALKLAAWVVTGSVVLLTSAVDALVDTGASFVTYFGVRYAERPPDRDHRFGHGKGEAVAGFTQAVFLAGAALTLVFQSVDRLISPELITSIDLGLWVIVVSLIAAAGLVVMQTWVVRRTGSTAIAADRAHYLTDVAVNGAALFALGVTKLTGWTRADPAFALAISVYMIWNAYGISQQVLTQLLDRELPVPDRQRIRAAVLGCAGVRDVHDLRTRYAGDRTFVEFHLEVDGDLTVDRGHEIGDVAERAVAALLPGTVEVTAHLEPAGIEDDRLDTRVRRSGEKRGSPA